MTHKKVTADSTGSAPDGEHALVQKLRSIVDHPEDHTVGSLAAAVDQALSELMMFRERIDLLADKDTAKTKGPKTPAPASGAAEIAPGFATSRRAS